MVTGSSNKVINKYKISKPQKRRNRALVYNYTLANIKLGLIVNSVLFDVILHSLKLNSLGFQKITVNSKLIGKSLKADLIMGKVFLFVWNLTDLNNNADFDIILKKTLIELYKLSFLKFTMSVILNGKMYSIGALTNNDSMIANWPNSFFLLLNGLTLGAFQLYLDILKMLSCLFQQRRFELIQSLN